MKAQAVVILTDEDFDGDVVVTEKKLIDTRPRPWLRLEEPIAIDPGRFVINLLLAFVLVLATGITAYRWNGQVSLAHIAIWLTCMAICLAGTLHSAPKRSIWYGEQVPTKEIVDVTCLTIVALAMALAIAHAAFLLRCLPRLRSKVKLV
jgi:hypothetical protein